MVTAFAAVAMLFIRCVCCETVEKFSYGERGMAGNFADRLIRRLFSEANRVEMGLFEELRRDWAAGLGDTLLVCFYYIVKGALSGEIPVGWPFWPCRSRFLGGFRDIWRFCRADTDCVDYRIGADSRF